MKTLIPYRDLIVKISNFERLFSDSNNLKLIEQDTLIKQLSWMSKFAFDEDYLLFNSKSILKGVKSTSSILTNYQNELESEEGYDVFLEKYPLLPTLKQKFIKQVIDYIDEIKEHFIIDQKTISKLFNDSLPLGDIKHIDIGLGDTHQCGKSTAILYLTCGTKIVYKPRNGELDLAFNALLKTINNQISNVNLKITKIISKRDYSWVEYIEHLPCKSLKDLSIYYHSCGSLLALVYLLRGTDMHFENIIAHSKYPVLIDLECLFNHTDMDHYTVLNVGLIPTNLNVNNNTSFDSSGLGASEKQETTIKFWKWENLNSDELQLQRKPGYLVAEKNQPVFNGKNVSPKRYVNEIIAGFRDVCQWVLQNKTEYNRLKPFHVFQNKTIRIIPRLTQDYKNILENSYIPNALKSNEIRISTILKYLNEFVLHLPLNDLQKEQIRIGELNALERMDIPFFTANTSDKYINESDTLILKDYYKERPYDFVMNKIQLLNQDEVDNQISIIKSAFTSRYNLNVLPTKNINNCEYNISLENEINSITNTIVKQVQQGDTQNLRRAFVSKGNDNLNFGMLEEGLYNGALGIALFLSRVDCFKENEKHSVIIDTIIREKLNHVFNRKNRQLQLREDLSISTGISGIIYTLLKVNPIKYKTEALELTTLITEDRIKRDFTFDILSGNAGCLAVLVNLYKITHSDRVLQKIKFIADDLLSKRIYHEKTNCRVWNSDKFHAPLTGFSHGVSGIAHGLLKAFEVTGNKKYKSAFYDAIDYENFFFDKNKLNWLDLRNGEKFCKTMWCHGSPGIGLSRLYAYKVLKDERLLEDVRNAIESVRSFPLLEKDFYCCGNIGRLDFLIEAASVLKDRKLNKLSEKKINELIMKKNDYRFYQIFHLPNTSLENPSFFRGLSGIGYTFLRSIDPVKYPCLGLFE